MSIDLEPGSASWYKLMTASKVAAVLGVSSYDSPRSLWHRMAGDVEPDPVKKNQARGHYLEPGVLAWFFDQHPEFERGGPAWLGTHVHDNGWAAATPDAMALDIAGGDYYPVEAKTDAGDGDEWGKAGTDEIPLHIAAQCTWTMHVLDAKRIYVPMVTQRLEFREYVVEYDADLAARIERTCKAFVDSLDAGVPPELDGHPATFESLKRVNPSIEDGSSVDLTWDQARLYVDAEMGLAAAKSAHNFAKSVVAEAMGTAQRAKYNGVLVARRQNTSSGVAALYAAKPLPTIESSES